MDRNVLSKLLKNLTIDNFNNLEITLNESSLLRHRVLILTVSSSKTAYEDIIAELECKDIHVFNNKKLN